MVRMQIPSNYDWPGNLREYKGSETTAYVVEKMGGASVCAACHLPFAPGAGRSFTVRLETNEPSDTPIRRFSTAVTHTECKPAEMIVDTSASLTAPAEHNFKSVWGYIIGDGAQKLEEGFPYFVYGIDDSESMTSGSGEQTDILVSGLIKTGFAMSRSDKMAEVLAAAAEVAGKVEMKGQWSSPTSLELDTTKDAPVQFSMARVDADAAFRASVDRTGYLLVICGTGIKFHSGSFDAAAAALAGKLVAALIPVVR